MIPQTAETEQLTKALLSEGTPPPGQPAVEKASPASSSALAVDANRGTLLADVDGPAPPVKRYARKKGSDCDASTSGPQLGPLRADDMRQSQSAGC